MGVLSTRKNIYCFQYVPPKSTWKPKEQTYTPPKSEWTPPEQTGLNILAQQDWTPPQSDWTPPKQTWSPPAEDEPFVQPEPASPMDQLIEMGFANR